MATALGPRGGPAGKVSGTCGPRALGALLVRRREPGHTRQGHVRAPRATLSKGVP